MSKDGRLSHLRRLSEGRQLSEEPAGGAAAGSKETGSPVIPPQLLHLRLGTRRVL